VGPDEGEFTPLGGMAAIRKIAGTLTQGAYSIVEHPLAPGTLVPPHVHHREDELMYILYGKIGARVGDEVVSAGPGTYVFKPRDVPHAFWNGGRTPGSIMHILSPAGFEHYFPELNRLIPKQGQPDFGEIAKLASRYGVEFRLDWVPDLESRFKVSVYGR